MKQSPVVDRAALLKLQAEIRELERRVDRPLPSGVTALRVFPSLQDERPGRAPVPIEHGRVARSCPLGRCDGSGWLLHETEEVASPCGCQRLPRDREARRQTRRILRRHLAPGLDSPPLSLSSAASLDRLGAYVGDLRDNVRAGSGLWLVGTSEIASAACAFVASEALRGEVATLLYPGDELVGRLRRLAGRGGGAIDHEVYERLGVVDLLVINGLDDAAMATRFPEPRLPAGDEEEEAGEESQGREYRPGMTMTDLARIFAVIDERLLSLKATVITTRNAPISLEEGLLCLPGEWPRRRDGGTEWNEPLRRVHTAKRLLSRLHGLCGGPISLDSKPFGDIRTDCKAAGDARRRPSRSRAA